MTFSLEINIENTELNICLTMKLHSLLIKQNESRIEAQVGSHNSSIRTNFWKLVILSLSLSLSLSLVIHLLPLTLSG